MLFRKQNLIISYKSVMDVFASESLSKTANSLLLSVCGFIVL